MNIVKKLFLVIATTTMLAACQEAVRAPVDAVYTVKGNKQSLLYPLEVKQNNEDVFIKLQANAPMPKISSFDAAENKIPFNFSLVENTIVVPNKFEHLRLSHGSDDVIDITLQHHD